VGENRKNLRLPMQGSTSERGEDGRGEAPCDKEKVSDERRG
jgi:hypothetical protein